MLFKSAQDWLLSYKEDFAYKENELNKQSCTISISSGKGGVGKTSVAIKLGLMLASIGKKVLLIDCDYNLSNTLVKIGVPINSNFYDLITAKKSFGECLYRNKNFHLLPGCNGNLEIFENGINIESLIIDIIAEHEGDYDYILLDCPAGISKSMLTLNAYTDHRIVVVNPDKSSITDSYAVIKLLNTKFGIDKNFLIANKISSTTQYKKLVNTLAETVRNFLNSELISLGGIRKLDQAVDLFDQTLIDDENSYLHKDFIKVMECFSEKVVSSACVDLPKCNYTHVGGLEHDVHINV